jgi:hypothetical protein
MFPTFFFYMFTVLAFFHFLCFDEPAVYPTPINLLFLLDIWGAAAALMIQRLNYSISYEEVHTLESTCSDFDEEKSIA